MDELEVQGGQLPERDDFIETKAQIMKDLGSDLAASSISGSGDYSALRIGLLDVIVGLIAGNKPRLMQLIYRVDIPERVLGRELESLSAEEAASRLTDMIINRERQKVSIRRAFR